MVVFIRAHRSKTFCNRKLKQAFLVGLFFFFSFVYNEHDPGLRPQTIWIYLLIKGLFIQGWTVMMYIIRMSTDRVVVPFVVDHFFKWRDCRISPTWTQCLKRLAVCWMWTFLETIGAVHRCRIHRIRQWCIGLYYIGKKCSRLTCNQDQFFAHLGIEKDILFYD